MSPQPFRRVTKWPQDQLQVPVSGERFMPPIARVNADLASGGEAFTMSGTFTTNGVTAGQVLNLTIPTDQDGDFWCDQIAMIEWLAGTSQSQDVRPSTLQITDMRTGRQLGYPSGIPTKFFTTLQLFAGDGGITIGDSPYPAGWRSTAPIPEPFCFTRQGGIILQLQFLFAVPAGVRTVDISFSGWKEFRFASGRARR
jgi:hypothetical protein